MGRRIRGPIIEGAGPATGKQESSDSFADANRLVERFNLEDVINGLAQDLTNLRAGRISIEKARASAELAKQAFNGIRLVVNVQALIVERSKLIAADGTAYPITRGVGHSNGTAVLDNALDLPTRSRVQVTHPAVIPIGAWPARMNAALAAGYCGEPSAEAFRSRVGKEYPPPRVNDGRRQLWLRDDLDRAIGIRSADTDVEDAAAVL